MLHETIIIEVFAGAARVSSALRHFGLSSCFGVDHVKHRHSCAPISIVDLTERHGQDLLLQWLNNPRVIGIFVAPPCGTASRARKIKLKNRWDQGPVPLRSDESPNGLSNLSFVNRMKISKANKLYHFTALLVKLALDRNLIICVENPQFSHFWATTFWANTFATSQETAYPFELARDIASVFVSIALHAGAKVPPQSFADIESRSEYVLHFVKRPLDPDLPKLANAKLLSSSPFAESQMKGGKIGDSSLDGSLDGDTAMGSVRQDHHPKKDDQGKIEVWGVYHEPMEFVQKAVEAGHPQSLRSCIPEILRKAVKVNAETTSLQRAKHRTEMMKSWRLMARELESEEQHLKASMPPHLNRILQSKRIKLWERLLREANYQDMGVVNEVVCGTPLVGETETTGLWPSKFVPAMVTEEQLQEISAREKWETIRKVATCDSPETDSQVWDKTLSELQQGWIVGPLKHSEVPDDCPLSRRFGVIQGEKTRCVDDFAKSSVNLAVQVTESPKPHTVDVLGALLGEVINAGPGDEPWLIRPFDLKDAYRQCGVATSSLKYSHIVVRDPSRKRAEIFQMLALPFGSVRSVHAFLRVSHSIWFILVHYLSILATNYFDDFVVVARESEAKHVTSVVHGVFKLLGWSFAESGAKAPDFKGKANALGVAVDVSSLHTGVVRIDNTESRKDDLSKLVQSILSTGTLTSIEALKLRGRMQFTAGQLFGRVARMCLNQVTQHAYHATGTQISLETSTALSRYSRFLLQGKPRSITKGLSDTWFVYTDASYEIVEGQNTAGFGEHLLTRLVTQSDTSLLSWSVRTCCH